MSLLLTDEYVVDTYLSMVYKIAYLRIKNVSEAEDICQDVFLKYVNFKKKFENEDHLKYWLVRVTINCCNSFWNSSWRKKTVSLLEDIPQISNVEHDIYSFVLNLPNNFKIVIHLYYYEEFSIKEISEILKVKSSTIRVWLTRARRLLKEKMREMHTYD